MGKRYILRFLHDDIRIVSNESLKKIILEIKGKNRKQCKIKITKIGEFGFWIYLIKLFNSNYVNCNLSWWENKTFPVTLNKILELYCIQLGSLCIDDQKCFKKIEVEQNNNFDTEILISCTDKFIELLKHDNNTLFLQDDLTDNLININNI